jgi:hypothetical protein
MDGPFAVVASPFGHKLASWVTALLIGIEEDFITSAFQRLPDRVASHCETPGNIWG